MTPRKNEPRVALDMDFEEALTRFSKADPKEIESSEKPLEVVQYEGAADHFLIFGGEDGPKVQVRFDEGDLWFTYDQIARIFGVDESVAIRHVQKFLDDGELDESTTAEFAVVREEGGRNVTRSIRHFGLDVAFYAGYRVNSKQGARFRRWATDVLVRVAKHGFIVDVQRLKEPESYDRVKELREIVRDIRASEAHVYREVRELCALVRDYMSGSREWQAFYARMQNKLFWAVLQATATQVRLERAHAEQPNMGLTAWSGKRIIQKDALTAKNYLAHGEAEEMNRLSVMLLDFFEDQLKIGVIVTMADLEAALDRFIRNANRVLLPSRGIHIPTKTEADTHCKAEYKRFSELRAMSEPEPDTRYLEG
jgi:hypothetical protein